MYSNFTIKETWGCIRDFDFEMRLVGLKKNRRYIFIKACKCSYVRRKLFSRFYWRQPRQYSIVIIERESFDLNGYWKSRFEYLLASTNWTNANFKQIKGKIYNSKKCLLVDRQLILCFPHIVLVETSQLTVRK